MLPEYPPLETLPLSTRSSHRFSRYATRGACLWLWGKTLPSIIHKSRPARAQRPGVGRLSNSEGSMARLEFVRVTLGEVSEEERARVSVQLEAYCGRDTEGVVRC